MNGRIERYKRDGWMGGWKDIRGMGGWEDGKI